MSPPTITVKVDIVTTPTVNIGIAVVRKRIWKAYLPLSGMELGWKVRPGSFLGEILWL